MALKLSLGIKVVDSSVGVLDHTYIWAQGVGTVKQPKETTQYVLSVFLSGIKKSAEQAAAHLWNQHHK